MNKKRISLLFLCFLSFAFSFRAFSSKQEKHFPVKNVVNVTIDSSINPATYSYLKSAYERAEKKPGTLLLIKLNTPGGLVSTTKKILNLMGEAKVPTCIWITPEAASATSAGALIASGAHFLFMSPGTNIGAATPINMNASDLGEDLRSKAINDLVALITSLSQTRGRNTELFAKMLKEAASYTSQEAKDQKIIDGIADKLPDLYTQLEGRNFELKGQSLRITIENPSMEEKPMDLGQMLLNIFADPNLAYILFLIGAALIYLEFQAPGSFIPGSIGAILIVLSGISFQVLPLNFGALALLVLAFILFIMEAYITSYGALSIAGLCSLVFGSLFLFRTDDSYLSVSHHLVLASSVSIAAFLFFLGFYLYRDSRGKKHRENYYSKLNRTGIITKEFGFDEEAETYRYLIRVEGELWSAYAKQNFKKGHEVTITGKHRIGMAFDIE